MGVGGKPRTELAAAAGLAIDRGVAVDARPHRGRDVPFFWSQHHDVTPGYVGHAERFDPPEVHGDLDARDAHVVYRDGGRVRAVVTLGRDRLGLEVEAAMERCDRAALDALVQR